MTVLISMMINVAVRRSNASRSIQPRHGHFSADLETGSVHPPIDVPRASSVHSVALATIADDHRRADLEVQFEAESTRQAHDDLDGRVRLAELDRGDI